MTLDSQILALTRRGAKWGNGELEDHGRKTQPIQDVHNLGRHYIAQVIDGGFRQLNPAAKGE